MPVHPSILTKLNRAKLHLDYVVRVSGDRDADGEIVGEKYPGDNRGELIHRIRPEPPPDLEAAIGDCLFNLRCSLDYLVYQLVLLNGETPGSHNSFPVCTDSSEFSRQFKDKRGRIKGVSRCARNLIESFQPYPGRNNALRVLQELNNIDKHRKLVLVSSVSKDFSVITPLFRVSGKYFRDGQSLGMGFVDSTGKLPTLKYKGQATAFVVEFPRFRGHPKVRHDCL